MTDMKPSNAESCAIQQPHWQVAGTSLPSYPSQSQLVSFPAGCQPPSPSPRDAPPPSPIFQEFWGTRNTFQNRLADELALLGLPEEVPTKLVAEMQRSTDDLRKCGTRFVGRKCSCDFITGALQCICRLGMCPTCSQQRSKWFAKGIINIADVTRKAVGEMQLSLVSFGLECDPASEADVSVDGLRLRRSLLVEAVRTSWRMHLKKVQDKFHHPGLALVTTVTPDGAIVAKGISCGPPLDVGGLKKAFSGAAAGRLLLSTQTLTMGADTPKSNTINRIAKYVCWDALPAREDIERGINGRHLDPKLAARAERGFNGESLLMTHGLFKDLDKQSERFAVKLADECRRCGATSTWTDVNLGYPEFLAASALDSQVTFAYPPVPGPVVTEQRSSP